MFKLISFARVIVIYVLISLVLITQSIPQTKAFEFADDVIDDVYARIMAKNLFRDGIDLDEFAGKADDLYYRGNKDGMLVTDKPSPDCFNPAAGLKTMSMSASESGGGACNLVAKQTKEDGTVDLVDFKDHDAVLKKYGNYNDKEFFELIEGNKSLNWHSKAQLKLKKKGIDFDEYGSIKNVISYKKDGKWYRVDREGNTRPCNLLAESGDEILYLLRKEFKRFEGRDTHVYQKHIDVTDNDLRNRVLDPTQPNKASRFYDEETALKALYQGMNDQGFRSMLNRVVSSGVDEGVNIPIGRNIGKGYIKDASGNIVEIPASSTIRIVLRKGADGRVFILDIINAIRKLPVTVITQIYSTLKWSLTKI